MGNTLRDQIAQRIHERGPLTVSEFMELALYHPTLGYYSRAARRTGRDGDFYTSVDVGPQFGALLATQLDEMHRLHTSTPATGYDLVEVGAGNGQLSRDVLDAAEDNHPELYAAVRLTLVEISAAARASQTMKLGRHSNRLESQRETLPEHVTGIILANEFLDALPTHAVMATARGLHEVYVDLSGDRLIERLGPPSTPALAEYLERLDIHPEPGWRGEINLAAVDWIRKAARRLERGFLILIDYGHTANQLYGECHAGGTLTTFSRHVVDATTTERPPSDSPAWLRDPGDRDITSHVDLTSICDTAIQEDLSVLGVVDQTRFLLGLGALDPRPRDTNDSAGHALKRRLALKSLLVPGGLGSTHTVIVLGKGMGTPALRGCSLARTWTSRVSVRRPDNDAIATA